MPVILCISILNHEELVSKQVGTVVGALASGIARSTIRDKVITEIFKKIKEALGNTFIEKGVSADIDGGLHSDSKFTLSITIHDMREMIKGFAGGIM
jgi:hypothetical protein